MTPLLTIVIACHNDLHELGQTIDSIEETIGPGNRAQIVVIDDCSRESIIHNRIGNCPLEIFRTQNRIGVGPARYLGAMHATGEYLLFVDAHMRFTPGWYEALMLRIVGRQKTVHCGVCLGLGYNGSKVMNMDVTKPNATYFGATWNFFGQDRRNSKLTQVFESVWADEKAGDDYELSGIMGANYSCSREWYIKLNCGRFLRSYGCDEQELALKTWLAGGEIRIIKGVRIGHKFKEAKKQAVMGNSLYNATAYVVRNKIFLIQTLLPPSYADVMMNRLQRNEREFHNAKNLMHGQGWADVEIEREHNRRMFTRDFAGFLQHFGLSFPSK